MNDRAQRALARLRRKFAASDHRPSPAQWEALAWILDELESQPKRRAAGDRTYDLTTLDCGIGKTQAIVAYAQELLVDHQAGIETGGMIIFSDRLADIYSDASEDAPESGLVVDLFETRAEREAAKAAGLFAIYTHDKARNRLGADPEVCFESPDVAIHNHVPLLLTTQAMLLQRSEDYAYRFSDIVPFWFAGNTPRSTLTWDEHLLAAMPLAIDPEMAGRLIPEMRKLSPDLADQFNDDMQALRVAPVGKLFYLRDYSAEFGLDQDDLYRCGGRYEEDQVMSLAVAKLQGKAGVVRRDTSFRSATTLLTYVEHLPVDLAPMLIADANGRFSYEYQAWAENRGNLTICPIEAPKSYANMTIRHWDTGSGRISWAAKPRRNPLLDGIVKYLNQLPHDEPVLILHFKEAKGQKRVGHGCVPSIPSLIKRHRTEAGEKVANQKRLLFTHWPAKATNRFRHVKHVVVSGAFFLPDAQYEAIARAAMGILPEDMLDQPADLARIVKAVDQGNLFQGILRGSGRLSDGDGCAECTTLIIGSSRRGITHENVAELFPYAPIIGWSPKQGDGAVKTFNGKLTKAQRLATFLAGAESKGRVTWSEIQEAIGEKHQPNAARLAKRAERWRAFRPDWKGLPRNVPRGEGGLELIG